jgi:formate hydrogenlyase subunit 3/multisubunit Na+/H+ antiporter MnhD subunit
MTALLISLLLFGVGAVTSLIFARRERWLRLFGAGGVILGSVCGFVPAIRVAMGAPPESLRMAWDVPYGGLHLRLDALSAFFLVPIFLICALAALYGTEYLEAYRERKSLAPAWFFLNVLAASMAVVVLANNAVLFLMAWETMALSSFFLVTFENEKEPTRQAGWTYLVASHIGTAFLLVLFVLLGKSNGSLDFDRFSPASGAGALFVLALAGFGTKAGFVPLHVWLPEAHPAAPSPVSALMSGVMLNTAVYGLLRVAFDLLHLRLWWWGALLLGIGLVTALYGVVYAAVQTDMKRLLAYSSIENMGLVFVGIGLALVFAGHAMAPMAALALTATLYHVASHAFFKSLLFVGTGSVLHATGERNLGRLGGLIRGMPWVGWFTLLGVLASAGLPPLGGFVSEWLLLQSFLFSPGLPAPLLTMLIPVVAALIALVTALAGYTMVKFFGVVFLGVPREETLAHAHDAGIRERIGMGWLVAGCVALGLLPVPFIGLVDPATRQLAGAGLAGRVADGGWLLAPNGVAQASYGPVVFLLGILACFALAYLLVRRLYHGRTRRSIAWACGFPWTNARMQDTAEGFGQPIRQIFEPFFRMQRELPTPFDLRPRYRVVVEDPLWHRLYLPIGRAAAGLARLVGRLQQGRIAVYLLYSFLTLVATLLVVMRA